MTENHSGEVILVFSGKRKCGKDYVTEKILTKLGMDICSILRLSAPLKKQYALEHNLDYSRLLDSSDYKEKYREDMIKWGENKRKADPGFFCQIITKGHGSESLVWIVSDARRKTDISYFKENFTDKLVINVRVGASEEVRKHRGWVFTHGVDDVSSECDLDSGVIFDLVLENNGDGIKMEEDLCKLCSNVKEWLQQRVVQLT